MAAPAFSRIVSRSKPEDQATEILALTLELDRELMRSFLASAISDGAPPSSVVAAFEVQTQRRVDAGHRRVDLALEGEDWAVWVEAKIDSDEGQDQLTDYAKALARADCDHRHLIYLTRPGASAPRMKSLHEDLPELDGRVAFHSYDWRQLGELARASCGSSTRSLASHLAKFLEDSGLYVGALEPRHIETLEGLPEAWAPFVQLQGLVHEEVMARGVGQPTRWEPASGKRGTVGGHWVNESNGTFGAWETYITEDPPADGHSGWLHWGLGLNEREEAGRALSIDAGVILRAPWEGWDFEDLREFEYDDEIDEDDLRVIRYERLAAFRDHDAQDQARRIADWVEMRFVEVLERPPMRDSAAS